MKAKVQFAVADQTYIIIIIIILIMHVTNTEIKMK